MPAVKTVQNLVVVLAWCGMALPVPVVGAKEPTQPRSSQTTYDIRLTPSRQLLGTVVNAQGQPLAEAEVRLTADRNSLQRRLITDDKGRFAFDEVAAGAYRLTTSEGICHCRVWTDEAAPPLAAAKILIVNDKLVQRGQRPIRELFNSDPIFMAAVVAAAIAIPVAIHQSRDDDPSGS